MRDKVLIYLFAPVLNGIFALYYKLYGFYILFFVFNIVGMWIYTDPDFFHNGIILLYMIILCAVLIGFSMNAYQYVRHNDFKKHSILVIIIGTLIFITPNIYAMYVKYVEYRHQQNVALIFSITDDMTDKRVMEIIMHVDAKALNVVKWHGNVLDKIVCRDNIALLDTLKQQGFDFTKKRLPLNKAVRCQAWHSVDRLLDSMQNISPQIVMMVAQEYIRLNRLQSLKRLFTKVDTSKNYSYQGLFYQVGRRYMGLDKERRKAFYNYLLDIVPVDKKHPSNTPQKTALYQLIYEGDSVLIQKALDKGADVNWRYHTNAQYSVPKSNFHAIRLNTDVKILTLLLTYGLVIDEADLEDSVHILTNNIAMLEEVLRYSKVHKLFIYYFYNKEILALMDKYITKDIFEGFSMEEQKALIDQICYHKASVLLAKVAPYIHDINQYSPLENFSCRSSDEMMNILLEETNIDFSKAKYRYLYTKLSSQTLIKIINHSTYSFENISDPCTRCGGNMLHYWVRYPEVLSLVMTKSIAKQRLSTLINETDTHGYTPLFRARNIAKSVEILLEHGADVGIRNHYDFTLFYGLSPEIFKQMKSYAKQEHIAAYECAHFVENLGQKSYQYQCGIMAQHIDNVNNKTFALFLAGAFEELITFTLIETKPKIHYPAFANVGHGHLLLGDSKKAKEYYHQFLVGARHDGKTEKYVVKMMAEDLNLIKKLYGEKYYELAHTIWQKILKDAKNRHITNHDYYMELKQLIQLNGNKNSAYQHYLDIDTMRLRADRRTLYIKDLIDGKYLTYSLYGNRDFVSFSSNDIKVLQHFTERVKPLVDRPWQCSYQKISKVIQRLLKDRNFYHDKGIVVAHKVVSTLNKEHRFKITHPTLKPFSIIYNSYYTPSYITFNFPKGVTTVEKEEIRAFICGL